MKVNDAEWCGDLGRWGAECTKTFTQGGGRSLDKPTWDSLRFGMVCTEKENLANWSSAITKLCLDTRYCTKDMREKVKNMNSNIEKLNKAGK